MTPKEKSSELVWKYYHNIEHTISNEYASKDLEISKQCALIAVDEVLNTNTLKVRSCGFVKLCEQHKEYWQEVNKRNRKIMTPKEKAKELFDKMKGFRVKHSHSKKCALIAVDEILNEYPSQCPRDSYEMERYLYWQEVKQEIQKLC